MSTSCSYAGHAVVSSMAAQGQVTTTREPLCDHKAIVSLPQCETHSCVFVRSAIGSEVRRNNSGPCPKRGQVRDVVEVSLRLPSFGTKQQETNPSVH